MRCDEYHRREAICNLRAKDYALVRTRPEMAKGSRCVSSRRSSCLNEEAADRAASTPKKTSVENHEVKLLLHVVSDQFRTGNAAVIGSSAPVVNIPLGIRIE